MYDAYQAQADLLSPTRESPTSPVPCSISPMSGRAGTCFSAVFHAATELFTRAGLSHERPGYDIDTVTVEGADIAVHEDCFFETPFARLLHFRKEKDLAQPKVLIVAPMAGHFATLLRQTAQTMLADHDVFITDWKNARDIPLAAGRFGTGEYVAHLIQFIEAIGPDAYAVAVCQPCGALLTAVAVMARHDNPAVPRRRPSTAGPVDASINPTDVNRFATSHTISWFKQKLIARVPGRFGAGRHVYPGFIQVGAFLSMNPGAAHSCPVGPFGHTSFADTTIRPMPIAASMTIISPSPTCRRSFIWRPCATCFRNSASLAGPWNMAKRSIPA